MRLTNCKRGGGGLGNKGFAVSGILYPILILTLFLIVQILTMMASRKAVLDKNKQQLLDSVNASNKIYTNEELSILMTELLTKNSKLENEVTSLKGENTALKNTINTLSTDVSDNYVLRSKLSDPNSKIKASIMNVYDGNYGGSSIFRRDYVGTPAEYKANASSGIYAEFKQTSVLGINGSMYSTLITINPYGGSTDFSGGNPYQFAITSNGDAIYKRGISSNTAWGSWTKIH